MKRYWVQEQAIAGNWVDMMGVDDLDTAMTHARYAARMDKVAHRVVYREDRTMAEFSAQGKELQVPR